MLSPRSLPKVSVRPRAKLAIGPLCQPIAIKDIQTTMKLKVSLATNEAMQRIRTATASAERFTNRVFVAQTWDMVLDGAPYEIPSVFITYAGDTPFGSLAIDLVKIPLLGVLGIYVTDESGIETQVDPNVYWVSYTQNGGRIALRSGQAWPYHRGFEGFRVRFVAGYAFPFTVSGGVISAPNHLLVNNQVIRVQTAEGDLPSGLQPDTDYTVSNVGPGTLQLLDDTGAVVVPGDQDSYSFLGEIPEPIRRAIVITAALEIGGDDPSKEGNRYAPVMLPITALELLRPYRIISI